MTTVYTVTWVQAGQARAAAFTDPEPAHRQRQAAAGQGALTFWAEYEVAAEPAATANNGPVILLDLNYTLVGNSTATFDFRRGPDLAGELYRAWLVALIRPLPVILVTTRAESYAAATLANIAAQTGGWQPRAAYFKPERDRFLPAPEFKERVLLERVLPEYGDQAGHYLALESNAQTRAMYAAYNIQARPVPTRQPWPALPPLTRLTGGPKAALAGLR